MLNLSISLLCPSNHPQHPFLLHTVLTLTLMHDKYLSPSFNDSRSTAMAHHWSLGASLLNQKLSHGFQPSDRDALWASAGLLGALAISSIPAQTPEGAWPLSANGSADLDWLRMCQGKRAIWTVADPLREDSIFYPFVTDFLQSDFFAGPPPIAALQQAWPEIMPLCGIDDAATLESNVCLASVLFLARTVDVDCTTANKGVFLTFFGSMHMDFEQELGRKYPPALLLLAYWYAKMCYCRQWWIWRRASLECQAICLYLKQHYANEKRILKALEYPEQVLLAAWP